MENFRPIPDSVETPINITYLKNELKNHPDKTLIKDLLDSFRFGFRIGYSGPEFANLARNLKSAETNPAPISSNLITELKSNRMAGPFVEPPLPNFRTSPIGVVPKKEPNKFRIITDLSSPRGASVNEFIPDCEARVQFENFDSAVNLVARLGKNSLLAKLDIKSAFRICPVHPADWHLLGFTFCDLFFVDLCLPFGLRSSVNRFTRVADTLSWIMQTNYDIAHSTHYLDDFLLAGEPDSDNCHRDLNKTLQLFDRLGVPLAPEKLVPPTTCLTYLGITIDSNKMEIRLPEERLSEVMALLKSWETRKKCTKRALLALIGKLSFCARVILSGRTFLRRLIDLSTSVSGLRHHISLNTEAREDIKWWQTFLPQWNGKHRILEPGSTMCPDMQLFTDASGCEGFGIYFDGKWISSPWLGDFVTRSIQWKELFPIFVACYIWAGCFTGKRLLFHCDNQAVVNIWSANTSRCPHIMHLLRKLFFITAKFNFTVNVIHIAGTNNSLADSLSRLQISKFRRLAPQAEVAQTQIPQEVWNL